jgi:hypothetical protein
MYYSKKFVLFDGQQSEKHKKAIEEINGDIIHTYDPSSDRKQIRNALDHADFAVICSNDKDRYIQTKLALNYNCNVIVEAPSRLPWEPIIDDNRINITLPYRYLSDIPKTAKYVKIVENMSDIFYIFYHQFIHYIDLSILLNAEFNGCILSDTETSRIITSDDENTYDILHVDIQSLYNEMYQDIVCRGKGTKPKDIFYLNWIMNKYYDMTYRFPYNQMRRNYMRYISTMDIKIDEWKTCNL